MEFKLIVARDSLMKKAGSKRAGKVISAVQSFKKALFIAKTQGARAVLRRGFAKAVSDVRALGRRRRRNRAWKRAVRLLRPSGRLRVPTSTDPTPDVSIIVPVYDQDVFTYNCLRALAEHPEGDIAVEVIVVDDGSPEATRSMLASIEGIRCVRNEQNLGFVASCNRGAAFASGELLAFLNNDTLVQSGWLSALVRRIRSDPSIGAVGSKLLFPNKRIAEAGAIVWRDGSGWNYGRGLPDGDPAFNYVRDADYCSAASLLVRRQQFLEAGGFDVRYSPAYYEDADLCFTLRARGLRTVLEPESIVVHFEGATNGIDERAGVKKFQVRNRERFAEKWARELQDHAEPSPGSARLAARRLSGRPRVLVIDTFVPFDDRDAGSLRLAHVLTLLRDLGCDVTFYPHDGVAHEPYAGKLRDRGIEVLGNTPRSRAERLLRERISFFDLAWICRPELMEVYAAMMRGNEACRIYYDTVDLHYVRLEREQRVTGRPTDWQRMREIEIGLAKGADGTIVTSPVERELLAAQGVSNVHVVPPMQPAVVNGHPYAERAGVLFVGNYTHAPNVDAATYLANEVFPMMADAIPGLRLTLAGNEPPPAVRALQHDAIRVTGYVERVEPLLQAARVFVAPLRFGAGIKGKIVQSMAHGLPTITTPIGAEGIGLQDGVDVLVADTASELATLATGLYEQPERWDEISRAGVRLAERYTPAAVKENIRDVLADAYPQAFSADYAKSHA